MRAPATLLLLALTAGGCASTSPEAAFKRVAGRVGDAGGHRVAWSQASPEGAEIDRAVRELLARDLGVDGAVQVALLRNRSLVATYEELGVAQADLVQAGLLRNPVLSGGLPPAEYESIEPPLVVGIAQDFLDLLTMPARKNIARARLEATEMRVTDEVLSLAAQVRAAYFELQAAEQRAAMRQVVAEAADTASAIASAQYAAGNLAELDRETQRALAEQARLDLARDQGEVAVDRERLVRAMGVWGAEARFVVPATLPELPPADPPLDRLEQMALSRRSDLQAMRHEVQAIADMRSLAGSTRWTGLFTVGVEAARLTDGHYVLGPNASVELPLFDQKQALLARLGSLERQSQARLEGRAIEVRSEVREAVGRLAAARGIAERYRTVVVPLRERIVALAQQRYDAMLAGVYELLVAKQNEVTTYRDYIDAVRDYWQARSDLERAVGGRLAPWPATTRPQDGGRR